MNIEADKAAAELLGKETFEVKDGRKVAFIHAYTEPHQTRADLRKSELFTLSDKAIKDAVVEALSEMGIVILPFANDIKPRDYRIKDIDGLHRVNSLFAYLSRDKAIEAAVLEVKEEGDGV